MDHDFASSFFLTPDMLTHQPMPHHSPALHPYDPFAASTIKMEDLQRLSETPPPTHDMGRSSMCDAKAIKKRKSWGQVLPEPKTNLPPRKRAKTDDEKEQRRIERVKRNRLAAHNSRERKRQEVELLATEKDTLAQELAAQRELNHKMAKELAAYRAAMPQGPPTPESLPTQSRNDSIAASIEDAYDHRHSSDLLDDNQSDGFPSPESMASSSPPETPSQPSTPLMEPTVVESDQTQHSAVSVGFQQSVSMDCKSSSLAHLDGFTFSHQPTAIVDDAPLDNMFDFSSFADTTSTYMEPQSFFDSSYQQETISPLSLTDPFGAKYFDLLADSGATSLVSDECGMAGQM